nr:PREDICTED: probable ergosterol biosynthetic protein 28 [Struthio camelus australis]
MFRHSYRNARAKTFYPPGMACRSLVRAALGAAFAFPLSLFVGPSCRWVNGLQARTFGIWTLLSSVIRCLCAIDIRNKTLYYITLFTFFMALVHFLSEVFIYHTAALTIGVMAPLMVASFSILGMLIGLQYLEVEALSQNKKKN